MQRSTRQTAVTKYYNVNTRYVVGEIALQRQSY